MFVIAAAALGAARNAIAPGGIDWIGQWADPFISSSDSTIARPTSALPNDPPFLTFEQAKAKHSDPKVIFVDARYPEDYQQGHMPGAILLPFEMFDGFWPGVEPRLPRDREIVTYCAGTDCELSLFLARLLRDKGYEHVEIFYGGAELWKDNRMPMDTTAAPPPGS